MATLTLDQKRLEQLRTQLYGKSELKPTKQSKSKNEPVEKVTLRNGEHQDTIGFIKKDLLKVLSLSAFVLFLQFVVYFALASKWLTINFYGISY